MLPPIYPIATRVIIRKSNKVGRVTEIVQDSVTGSYFYRIDSNSVKYTESELEEVPVDLLPELLRLRAKLEGIERQMEEIQTDLYDKQNSILGRLELLETLVNER
jgi:hypothetical protein